MTITLKTRTEQTNNFHRHRGNRRKQDWNKAKHKLHLTKGWTSGYDDSDLGRLRKGKIHCSCWLCRSKTNRRKVWNVGGRHGNNWPINDVRKIESMEDQDWFHKNEMEDDE